MKNFDTVLVGFDHSHGDPAVLIVGRKAPGDNVRFSWGSNSVSRCLAVASWMVANTL